MKELPASSVPLKFTLERSLSRSSSPCACLVADLPVRHDASTDHHQSSIATSSAVKVEDFRETSARPCISVYRVLDPEHREPFVSAGRLFAACAVSPVQGLLRFKLVKPEYDCTLGGIAPFVDIWIPMQRARAIAKELGVSDELEGLLEWSSRSAYTIEDKEEGGLVHNWRISTERIAPSDYSTASMTKTPFPRVHLLGEGNVIRTLSPRLPAVDSKQLTYERALSRNIQWSSLEVEGLADNAGARILRSTSNEEGEPPADLAALSIWHSMTGIMALDDKLSDSQADSDEVCLTDQYSVAKADFVHGPDTIRRTTLAHFFARVMIRDWHSHLQTSLRGSTLTDRPEPSSVAESATLDKQMVELGRRMQRLEREEHSSTEHTSMLQNELEMVRTRMDKLDHAVSVLRKRGMAASKARRPISPIRSSNLLQDGLSNRELVLFGLIVVLLVPYLK